MKNQNTIEPKPKKLIAISVIGGLIVLIMLAIWIIPAVYATIANVNLKKSLATVDYVNMDVKISDGGSVVYAYNKSYEFNGNNATINIVTSTLDDKFQLVNSNSTTVENNVNRKKLINLSTWPWFVIRSEVEDNATTVIYQKSAVKNAFGDKVKPSTEMTVVYHKENGVTDHLLATFGVEGGKTVSVAIYYTYGDMENNGGEN